jgi:hypothetical protein
VQPVASAATHANIHMTLLLFIFMLKIWQKSATGATGYFLATAIIFEEGVGDASPDFLNSRLPGADSFGGVSVDIET